MPKGGTFTLAAANIDLDARFVGSHAEAKIGAYVLLQVSDTGEGMRPEIRKRIFEPFFTTKETGKGTGIGLATVHAIVKSHGGFLCVESELGQGTTFKVYLPADSEHRATDATQRARAEPPRGRGELVLVVDDEFSIRSITQQTLEAFGYRVLTADNGADAVALFAKQPSDIALVLTDMMLPVMDGAATIRAIRLINPSVRIIATSGVDSADAVVATSVGVTHLFLLKPYTAEILLNRIREALDQPALSIAF
jgi:CheY-like chemotaxis protein